MGKNTAFAYWVENYNVVKDLLFKGYKVEEIKELTGLSEESIRKYEEIVNSNYLIIKGELQGGVR
ncbi:MAG: hypothetical protein QMD71_09740 [bacterium]|nr:hypothetical protein [bacterium]